MAQKPPRRIEAPSVSADNAAVIIFLHGFGDTAEGWINIAEQFHAAQKLLYLTWIFPNAPHNHEAMTTAWYTPTSFSPIPIGKSSSESLKSASDDEEDEDEDEEGILKSVDYVFELIEEEVEKGIPLNRIVLGGFSQGCAISLVAGLSSRYAGKLGGLVGLSGYLPLRRRVRRERENLEKERKEMHVFLAHGTRDTLVPMRIFRDYQIRVKGMVGDDFVEAHDYEGMGHNTSGLELRDVCVFLEKILPG